MQAEKIRDCTLIHLNSEQILVVTCDSIGAIGSKEMDCIRVPPQVSGYETAKVALAELLSLGAVPIALSDGLCVEMNPTGSQMITGIKKAIAQLSEYSISLTGSCEDNIPTVQTGAGITAIGLIHPLKVLHRLTQKGDIGVLFGKPLYGDSFTKELDKALNLTDFKAVRNIKSLKEMVPVGSKGIAYEIEKVADDNEHSFKWKKDLPFDIHQSGGPAACCIGTIAKENLDSLNKESPKKITVLGTFQ